MNVSENQSIHLPDLSLTKNKTKHCHSQYMTLGKGLMNMEYGLGKVDHNLPVTYVKMVVKLSFVQQGSLSSEI